MEYTQWVTIHEQAFLLVHVLILVVMEYTQWVLLALFFLLVASLNPCCNGIYSMSVAVLLSGATLDIVLILVVMEYTQWVRIIAAIPAISVS